MNDFLLFIESNNAGLLKSTNPPISVPYPETIDFYSKDAFDPELLQTFHEVFSANTTTMRTVFSDQSEWDHQSQNLMALKYFIGFMGTITDIPGIEVNGKE